MASFQEILYKVKLQKIVGDTSVQLLSVQTDSRKVKPGSCFIAVKGTVTDGHQYIGTAIENGAIAIVCEDIPKILNEDIHYAVVSDSGEAAAIMAHNFYGRLLKKLRLLA